MFLKRCPICKEVFGCITESGISRNRTECPLRNHCFVPRIKNQDRLLELFGEGVVDYLCDNCQETRGLSTNKTMTDSRFNEGVELQVL